MSRLAKKTAIITGAGSGIGRAIALAFLREGANVTLVGRREEPLRATAAEGKGPALTIASDITSKTNVDRVMAETVSHFGGLNVLVNNAGVLHPGTAEQMTEAQWDETFNTNVRAVWMMSVAALPHLRKAGGGSIVNVASVLGINGARNRGSYAPSKGAVVLLTKCMAIDHGPEKIRVNALCPSFVVTDLTASVVRQASDPDAMLRERTSAHPLGRLGQPEDMAGMAVYLASDESGWVTGGVFPVDGGYLAV